MTANLLDRFGITVAELANVEERVGDDELTKGPYFMVLCAFTRAQPEKEAVIRKPFETWKGFGEVNGRWIIRSVAARAHLNRLLMAQAQYHGLAFWDVTKKIDEEGAVLMTPGLEGAYQLVAKATGEPHALAGTVLIDPKKGKLAGNGRAFSYACNLVAKPLGYLLKRDPSLPMSDKAVLAIAADNDDAEDGAGLAPKPAEVVATATAAPTAPVEEPKKPKKK